MGLIILELDIEICCPGACTEYLNIAYDYQYQCISKVVHVMKYQ